MPAGFVAFKSLKASNTQAERRGPSIAALIVRRDDHDGPIPD